MVCADTNCWIAFLGGQQGRDVQILKQCLISHSLAMAPIVLAELLSSPNLSERDVRDFLAVPLLEVTEGYWSRGGRLRARLLGLGYRPKLADTLIAQSCLDYQAWFMTRDRDFSPFTKHAGLSMVQ